MSHAIRDYRALKGLSIRQMADALGISETTLSNIETGKVKANNRTVGCIARWCKISMEDAHKFVAGEWVSALGPRGGITNVSSSSGLSDSGRVSLAGTGRDASV